jgi:hypothetical protein
VPGQAQHLAPIPSLSYLAFFRVISKLNYEIQAREAVEEIAISVWFAPGGPALKFLSGSFD